MIRVATYQRVSTADQHVENQAQELRRYVEARGWMLAREYADSGVSGALTSRFISLKEGLDWTTPAGRLQAQLLGMISEFERARIAERVRVGMARAKSSGKHVGRPASAAVTDADLITVAHLSVREAAARLGVSKSWIASRRKLSRRVA